VGHELIDFLRILDEARSRAADPPRDAPPSPPREVNSRPEPPRSPRPSTHGLPGDVESLAAEDGDLR
jgi:hypothetical protein